MPDGQAATKGLRTGDAIMGINGTKLDSDVDHATLVSLLRQLPRPFTLHMRRAASGKKRIEFAEMKIGIDITRTPAGTISISKVAPGGAADLAGIAVGDTLDGVNDTDITSHIGKPIMQCNPAELRFWFMELERPVVLNLNCGKEQLQFQQQLKSIWELPQSLSKMQMPQSLSKMQSPSLKALAKKSRKSLANIVTQVQAQARSAVDGGTKGGGNEAVAEAVGESEAEGGAEGNAESQQGRRATRADECEDRLRQQDASLLAMQREINGYLEDEGVAPVDAVPDTDQPAARSGEDNSTDCNSAGRSRDESDAGGVTGNDSGLLHETLTEMDKSLDCVATSALSEAADIMKLCQEMEQQRESYQLSEMKLTVETLMASKRNLEDELAAIDSKFSTSDDAMFAMIDIDDLENAQEGGWERAGTPDTNVDGESKKMGELGGDLISGDLLGSDLVDQIKAKPGLQVLEAEDEDGVPVFSF
jgi:S1-C subfamily serine protease